MDEANVQDDAHATSVAEVMKTSEEPLESKASSQAGAKNVESSPVKADKGETKPVPSHAPSLQGQGLLKSPPLDEQQPVTAKHAATWPVSASASPPSKKRKGRPKASEGMDEEAQKEFYRKRNAMYSRRKYMRKKIEIEVLQGQKDDNMAENRRLKNEYDHLSSLLQDAKQVVALHETHGLHGFDLARPALGLVSSPSSSINPHQTPINTAQEQPSALAGLASAAHLPFQLQRHLSTSLSQTMEQTRPPVSATTGLMPDSRRLQQQWQQLSLPQGRVPNSLPAANSLEQELYLYDLLLAQIQSGEALHSAASASIPQGLLSAQDVFQNVQMQVLLSGQNLGQTVQQGRQLPLQSLLQPQPQPQQPSVASVLHQQTQGGVVESNNRFATSSSFSNRSQPRPSHSLSTEDILLLLQHGDISSDDAAALLELTTAPSESSMPPPARAAHVASSMTNQDPALPAIDSATFLFLLQQQEQQRQQQQQQQQQRQQQQWQPQRQQAPPASPASSTFLDFLRRQNTRR